MKRKFVIIALMLATVFFLLAQPAAAKQKGERGGGVIAANPSNSRLDILVGVDGRFNMGAFPNTPDSWNLMYAWPNSPWSSFTTIRIDGFDSIYGSSGTQIQAPTDINPTTNESIWQEGDIEITQVLQIVNNPFTNQPDTAKIAYTVRNVGQTAHSVGTRVMIDTMINSNDGAPFRVPNVGPVTMEQDFIGAGVPDSFNVFYDLSDTSHTAAGILKGLQATAPDRFVIAAWPNIEGTYWDYTVDPLTAITNDSAYGVYWYPANLAPGQSRTYATYYGLGEVNVNLEGSLGLGVTGPAALSLIGGQYSPNPFDVVGTVVNNGLVQANDITVTINLPVGLSLASGSADQAVGNLAVGQEQQVTWSVMAAPQVSDTILTYAVVADGSNTNPTEVQRQIYIPAIDGSPPVISNLQPANGVTVNNAGPTISADYSDVDNGIDASTVQILVDGVDQTAQATVTNLSVSYTPASPLGAGPHSVEVHVSDNAGNPAVANWTFNVAQANLSFALVQLYWDSQLDVLNKEITFEYAVTNTGNGDALNTQIKDIVPSGGVIVVTPQPHSIGTVAAGASVNFTIKYKVPAVYGHFIQRFNAPLHASWEDAGSNPYYY